MLVSVNDRRLEALIRAERRNAEKEIERLVLNIAQPLISAILSRYARSRSVLTRDDAEDVAATARLQLVAKLRLIAHSAEEAVRDFDNYVATLAYNAINDHLRRSFPARARLKNQMRYVLKTDARLGLWAISAIPIAGLRGWSGTEHYETGIAADLRPRHRFFDRGRLGDALVEILTAVERPVLLDALVAFCADLWKISDAGPASVHLDDTPSLESSAAMHFETREYLRVLWNEIAELRPMQRKALLLNLRSGEAVNVVSLLVLTGTASFGDVAAVLEMSPAELTRIWNDLPLDDLRIAERLGVTRQQVIDLRKAARERLARRMSR